MNTNTIEKLRNVSVATLATALFKRGLRHQVIQDVRPVSQKGTNMVGPAVAMDSPGLGTALSEELLAHPSTVTERSTL